MEISPANPLQFWLTGQETYNESQPFGVNKKCFYAPRKCDVATPVQFTDTEIRDYRLTFYDAQDNEITQLLFTRELIENLYVYSLSFIPNDLGLCNKKISAQISHYIDGLAGGVTDIVGVVSGEAEVIVVSSRTVIFLEDPEVCGGADVTVYYTGAFAPGTTLYLDAGLLILADGNSYVADSEDTGNVYNIDSGTAKIGIDTGFDCFG